MFAQAPSSAGKPAAAKSSAAPDISGVWAEWRRLSVIPNAPKPPGPVSKSDPMILTPYGQERFVYNKDPFAPRDRGRNELDPSSHCFPTGPARLAPPFEIVQLPTKVMIVYEDDHTLRQIFTDGREHPKDLELTWNGHSTGKWDGDTLVVDTVGMRDETWLDGAGHVHSDQLQMVERIHLLSKDVLEIAKTLSDPKILAKPWTETTTYPRSPGWDLLEVNRCEDRLQRGVYFGEGPSGL